VFNIFYDQLSRLICRKYQQIAEKVESRFVLTLCELNLDITEHMCLPTQCKKLFAFYWRCNRFVQSLAF